MVGPIPMTVSQKTDSIRQSRPMTKQATDERSLIVDP